MENYEVKLPHLTPAFILFNATSPHFTYNILRRSIIKLTEMGAQPWAMPLLRFLFGG